MIKFNIKNFRHVMIVWTFSHLVCRSGSWRSLCCISESVTAQIHIQYIIIITIIDVYQVEAGVSGVLHVAKPIQTLGYFSTRLISAGKYCHHAFLLQRDQSTDRDGGQLRFNNWTINRYPGKPLQASCFVSFLSVTQGTNNL